MPYIPKRVVAAGLITAGVLGGLAGSKIDDNLENRAETRAAAMAEPSCDVKVEAGDTLEGIHRKLGMAGDTGDSEQVLRPDGTVRTPENTPRYFIAGSKGLEAGDTARVSHVGANVCEAVGGEVVPTSGDDKAGDANVVAVSEQ